LHSIAWLFPEIQHRIYEYENDGYNKLTAMMKTEKIRRAELAFFEIG